MQDINSGKNNLILRAVVYLQASSFFCSYLTIAEKLFLVSTSEQRKLLHSVTTDPDIRFPIPIGLLKEDICGKKLHSIDKTKARYTGLLI